MSDAAAGNTINPVAGAMTGPAVARPRRSYVGMIVGDTVRVRAAQLGLAWIVVLAVCGLFAPFLANSYPYIARTVDGELSFPLFRYLYPIDVLLPVLAILAVALILLRRRVPARWGVAIFAGLAVVATALCFSLIAPPQREAFGDYRQMRADGRLDWAISAPIPFSPTDRQSAQRYVEPAMGGPHWMGTNAHGSDVLSRMIHASRIALSIGFIATGIALVIGVIVGGLMGFFSGIVDLIGMRLIEIFAAIPTLFLLLTLIAVMPPEWNPYRLYVMMVIIGITGWVGYARFTRAEFLKLRRMDYVQASLALGLPLRSILFRHMLPNGVAPVLVEASFGIAGAILTESFLSFLGLGLVNEPSWGQMLDEAISGTGSFKWWMAIFPGGAIFLTVFAYNLIGESLRDAIDPHTKRAAAL